MQKERKQNVKNKKLRIAVLGHKRIPSREGGIEIVVEELSVRMAKLGHQVTIYNSVIDVLSKIKTEKIISSISVGFKAERLYFVYYKGKEFNENVFSQQMLELIQKDKKKMNIENLPWDGVGCWNPVFPALGYDMYMAASVAVEMMTKLIINNSEHKYTCVFEKKYGMDGLLIGYERICE